MIPLRDNLRVKDFPLLTVLLVVINVVVFFGLEAPAKSGDEMVFKYGTVPYEVTHPGDQCMPSKTTEMTPECDDATVQQKRWKSDFPPTWTTFFSSMFMHANVGHLIGNMIYLIVFGLSLEAGLGRASFLLFYVVGGLGADAGHIAFDPNSQLPMIGASGAIAAVMGGYLMLFPGAKIFTWIVPPMPFLWGWIRANWVIGIFMAMQVLLAYLTLAATYGTGGGVAYFAHFGGFFAGLGLVKVAVGQDRIVALRKQARIASGDEERIVEHIAAPPGQPAPHPAYPYMAPQQAQVAQPGQEIFGQSPLYAGPTAAYANPMAPESTYPQSPGYPQDPGYPQAPGYPQTPGYPQAAGYPAAPVQPPAPGYPGVPGQPPAAYGSPAAPAIAQPDPFAPPPDPFAPPVGAPPPPQPPRAVPPDPFAPPPLPPRPPG